MQATEDRIQLSAGGIFNIGMNLLPSVSFASIEIEENRSN